MESLIKVAIKDFHKERAMEFIILLIPFLVIYVIARLIIDILRKVDKKDSDE